jgi:hypothetical protein
VADASARSMALQFERAMWSYICIAIGLFFLAFALVLDNLWLQLANATAGLVAAEFGLFRIWRDGRRERQRARLQIVQPTPRDTG